MSDKKDEQKRRNYTSLRQSKLCSEEFAIPVSNWYAQVSVFKNVYYQFRCLPLTPDWWSFLRSPCIQTELKAFSKSMDVTAPFCLFLLTSLHIFSMYNNLTVLRCDWKPSCSVSIAFNLKNRVIWHQVIVQRFFDKN